MGGYSSFPHEPSTRSRLGRRLRARLIGTEPNISNSPPMNSIEPLESRIAPASVFVTYIDLDGDVVKITATKPGAVAPPLDATDLAFVGGGAAGQLATVDLTALGFNGAKI